MRGGSWNNNRDNARCSYRNDNHPDNRNDNIGFRVVRGSHIVRLSDSKRELWAWKRAIVARLARLRLIIHEGAAQVVPVRTGIP